MIVCNDSKNLAMIQVGLVAGYLRFKVLTWLIASCCEHQTT